MQSSITESVAPNVVAITVTFHPDLSVLEKQLMLLVGQVKAIVIVDNGSGFDSDALSRISAFGSSTRLIELGENEGIAAAQNEGIKWAISQDADFVVLFDQDSQPAPDMIAQLVHAHGIMVADGYKVASVGPRYVDPRRDTKPPFIRFEGLKLVRCLNGEKENVVRVDFLISSGCLIPIQTINAVGMMKEELFIDYVDIEWGLRARYCGYQSFGSFDAHMEHSLGDSPAKFFGRSLPLHSPLRHYYLARNGVWLYRQPWPPTNWKIVDAWRMLLKFGYYSLFAKPRWHHFKMMMLGFWHGMRGRMGALPVSHKNDFMLTYGESTSRNGSK